MGQFSVGGNNPKIKVKIEHAQKLAEEKIFEQKGSLQADIQRLQGEKTTIERAIKVKQIEQSKLPNQISKAIRIAFQSASDDGIKSLSEVAIFKALFDELDNKRNIDRVHVDSDSDTQPTIKIKTTALEPSSKKLSDIFREIGFKVSVADSLSIVTQLTIDSGLNLILSGFASAYAAQCIARSLSKIKAKVIDIPIGLVDEFDVERSLRANGDWDTLVLQNFNFSSIEAYGSFLLNQRIEQIASGLGKSNQFLIASTASGFGALPIPESISKISVHINLELDEYPDLDDDLDTFRNRIDEEFSINDSRSRPWKIALRRLLETTAKLSLEDQGKAIPVLYSSLRGGA